MTKRQNGKIHVGLSGIPESTDVLVIGLGITGAGVALDAASRGLDVVAVDAEDVAFGTSRWSSKLVHGGLRYLAQGKLDIAHESAVERGILMQVTAPHLVHALPMLMPLTPAIGRKQAVLARAGIRAGDVLRLAARTRREILPEPRLIGVTEALTLAPVVRREGLRGALLSWDGQLEDDVRLVLAVARTAAAQGAHVHTRVRVSEPIGEGAVLTDARTGETRTIRARAVISATGVWAGDLVPEIRLRPSRGTHIVLRKETLPGVRCAVMAPVPEASNRYVFALPQPDQTFYVGLTDEEVDGEIPDVPVPPEEDIEFLLRVINSVLQVDVRRDEVVGAYAGLRPLLDTGTKTADLSRKHAVLVSSSGVVTVVGRQADDLPQDGAGRGRPGGSSGRSRRRPLPRPGRCPWWVPRPDPSWRPATHRNGWCVASAPRPPTCSPGRWRRPVCPRRSCWRRSLRASTRRWPSWSSGSPTRERPRWRTCWTGVRASGWCPRTASWPGRPPSAR